MFYVAIFGLVAALLAAEAARPLSPLRHALGRRWFSNVALFACYQAVLIWVVPAYATAGAQYAAERGWGLFNYLGAPAWLMAVVVLLVVDCLGYLTHRAEHAVPALWRIHRAHHSDPDLDLTTGLRFHPLEMLLRGSIAASAMVLLGAPVAIVAGCVLLTSIVSLVSHVNADLMPARLESILQGLLVTPRMHRIHHSAGLQESNSNFGTALSIWDRTLGTYRHGPQVSFAQMQFGVIDRTAADSVSIGRILADPVLAE